ncbi:hypothetical protein BDR06DRAFT_968300 [Suillus hirtellus]|nr:hypothetical protein BDR06DRAFT_968300 [Suillus hirtellus]
MLLESGWQKTSELEVIAAEFTNSTEGINKLIFDVLSTIRGKLVNEAEGVLSSLNLYPPNDSTLSEEEKTDYVWQCILCAICHASEGRLSKRSGVIHFTMEDYSGVAGGICQSMLQPIMMGAYTNYGDALEKCHQQKIQ